MTQQAIAELDSLKWTLALKYFWNNRQKTCDDLEWWSGLSNIES